MVDNLAGITPVAAIGVQAQDPAQPSVRLRSRAGGASRNPARHGAGSDRPDRTPPDPDPAHPGQPDPGPPAPDRTGGVSGKNVSDASRRTVAVELQKKKK